MVKTVKFRAGHKNLSPDFKCIGRVSPNVQGDGSDRADIGRDVFACFTIAAGESAFKCAVAVPQRNGEPVVFQLEYIFGCFGNAGLREPPVHALLPVSNLLAAVGI